MKLCLKTVLLGVILAAVVLLPHHYVSAAACGSSRLAETSQPYIGANSIQPVTAAKGDNVTINIQLEDGCGGQSAIFDVFSTGSTGQLIKQITVTLDQGTAVPNQPVSVFKANWTVDLGDGSYYLRVAKIAGIFGGVQFSNTLNVRTAQACNISTVYPSPSSGLKPGQAIQLIVEATGSCQGWKASLNVLDLSSNKSVDVVFQGSGQDVSSGKAVWGWTVPASLKANNGQSNFYSLSANMGAQLDVQSRQFCVGNCSSDGSAGPPPGDGGVPGTTDKTYSFRITNPLAGGPNDLFDIINVVTQWIMYIAIPLAVLWIMYAGFLMLTAGPTPANFQKGRDILKYTILGLAIIFIGKGFVSLIISIIELGGATPTSQTQTQNPPGSSFIGSPGSACQSVNECQGGLKCQNGMCERQGGNAIGEGCRGGTDCAQGLACDNTAAAQIVVNGNRVGTCFAPNQGPNLP